MSILPINCETQILLLLFFMLIQWKLFLSCIIQHQCQQQWWRKFFLLLVLFVLIILYFFSLVDKINCLWYENCLKYFFYESNLKYFFAFTFFWRNGFYGCEKWDNVLDFVIEYWNFLLHREVFFVVEIFVGQVSSYTQKIVHFILKAEIKENFLVE